MGRAAVDATIKRAIDQRRRFKKDLGKGELTAKEKENIAKEVKRIAERSDNKMRNRERPVPR